MKKNYLLFRTVIFFVILIFFVHVTTSQVIGATYDTYINDIPTPALITPENQPVVDRLIHEINKMLMDQNNDGKYDHLAPGVVIRASGGSGMGQLYWNTPGELIGTLSWAYPYLPSSLKTKVKSYLDSEIELFNPLTTGYFPPNVGNLGQQLGIRREAYPFNPNHPINYWPGIDVTIEIAYPLWQYTYYTNDRRFIDNTTNWNSLVNLYNNFKAENNVTSFTQIAGITGFVRLAKLKGDTMLANDATNFVKNTLSTPKFSIFSSNADTKYQVFRETVGIFNFGSAGSTCCTEMFAGLFAPEVGKYLRDNEYQKASDYIKRIERVNPLWSLTMPNWGGDLLLEPNDENQHAPLEYGWTNFMLHAYVKGEDMTTLKKYIDFPSRLGDLFFIQELITIIEAKSDPAVLPSPSNSVVSTVARKLGDCEPVGGDGDIDIFDYDRILLSFASVTDLACDFVNLGSIDIYDYTIMVSNFGK